jgi:hypothetical protein
MSVCPSWVDGCRASYLGDSGASLGLWTIGTDVLSVCTPLGKCLDCTNFTFQLDALISQIYFGMKLYIFRTVPLSIIRSHSLYTQRWYMSYRFVDSFRAAAGSGWNCTAVTSWPVWHIPLLSVQWVTPDDGQRNCPKHVEFQLVLVGFIIRKSILCVFYMFRTSCVHHQEDHLYV